MGGKECLNQPTAYLYKFNLENESRVLTSLMKECLKGQGFTEFNDLKNRERTSEGVKEFNQTKRY